MSNMDPGWSPAYGEAGQAFPALLGDGGGTMDGAAVEGTAAQHAAAKAAAGGGALSAAEDAHGLGAGFGFSQGASIAPTASAMHASLGSITSGTGGGGGMFGVAPRIQSPFGGPSGSRGRNAFTTVASKARLRAAAVARRRIASVLQPLEMRAALDFALGLLCAAASDPSADAVSRAQKQARAAAVVRRHGVEALALAIVSLTPTGSERGLSGGSERVAMGMGFTSIKLKSMQPQRNADSDTEAAIDHAAMANVHKHGAQPPPGLPGIPPLGMTYATARAIANARTASRSGPASGSTSGRFGGRPGRTAGRAGPFACRATPSAPS